MSTFIPCSGQATGTWRNSQSSSVPVFLVKVYVLLALPEKFCALLIQKKKRLANAYSINIKGPQFYRTLRERSRYWLSYLLLSNLSWLKLPRKYTSLLKTIQLSTKPSTFACHLSKKCQIEELNPGTSAIPRGTGDVRQIREGDWNETH